MISGQDESWLADTLNGCNRRSDGLTDLVNLSVSSHNIVHASTKFFRKLNVMTIIINVRFRINLHDPKLME